MWWDDLQITVSYVLPLFFFFLPDFCVAFVIFDKYLLEILPLFPSQGLAVLVFPLS